jgi:hypothetical protein
VTTSRTEPPLLIESFGKGLIGDILRKLPVYLSDSSDGLTIKSLSATMFLFFACLAPPWHSGDYSRVLQAGL